MIEVSRQGRVALIILQRPEKHNALNVELCHRLRERVPAAPVLNEVFEPALDPDQDKGLTEAFEACWASEDFAEGRRARAEKRAPVFEGR